MDADTARKIVEGMTASGFDAALRGLEILTLKEGRAVVRIAVAAPVANAAGNLHGGAIATLVDDVGTLAIVSSDKQQRPGVTTDLNVSFLAPGRPGEQILVEATLLKLGRSLAFVSVELRREADGVLVAQGRMTKMLG
jgi:acyl-coenzyme A thioesterase 13